MYCLVRCTMVYIFSVPSRVEAITRQCLIALSLSVLCGRIKQACSRVKGYKQACSHISGYRLALVVVLKAIGLHL